jgi:chemotaxis protein CheD
MGKEILVDMACFNAAEAPDVLTTMGIGSCVAVCLLDRGRGIGGLAHIMLPHNKSNDLTMPGKFADTGIEHLIRLMVRRGAAAQGMTAKIVGGASMLAPGHREGAITVGKNNTESVTAILQRRNIRIIAQDVGGIYGRGLAFHPATGAVDVTVYTQPVTKLTL